MQVSLFTVLFVAFLVLKLTHQIAWSWLWVSAPLWGPIGMWLAFMGFCLAMAAISGQIGKR